MAVQLHDDRGLISKPIRAFSAIFLSTLVVPLLIWGRGPGQEPTKRDAQAPSMTTGSDYVGSDACISCHARGSRLFWYGSPHESRNIACVGCHVGHEPETRKLSSDARFNAPLTDVQTRKQEPELCLQCHLMRRAQLQRSSHMPYREGKVTCTSCHNPHGSPNPHQLLQATTNENCYSCHTERRGPFL